jgi:hypothetical protein
MPHRDQGSRDNTVSSCPLHMVVYRQRFPMQEASEAWHGAASVPCLRLGGRDARRYVSHGHGSAGRHARAPHHGLGGKGSAAEKATPENLLAHHAASASRCFCVHRKERTDEWWAPKRAGGTAIAEVFANAPDAACVANDRCSVLCSSWIARIAIWQTMFQRWWSLSARGNCTTLPGPCGASLHAPFPCASVRKRQMP